MDSGTIMAIVGEIIAMGWVTFYWVTGGIWLGYLGTLIFELRRHWKARDDFRALGEGDALQPIVSALILAMWPIYIVSAWVDTANLTESQIPNPIAGAAVLVMMGSFLGWFLAYERFLKPSQKVLKINQLPGYYKAAIGLQDLSVTFDCLWRSEKFFHLWSGFSDAPCYKVNPEWSKYYRELASYYPRRGVKWGTTAKFAIGGLTAVVTIIKLFFGS